MRLTPSDTVDHVDLNGSFRRPSSSHEERILRRNLRPASFCENFVLAVFSTFSTESAPSGSRETSAIALLLGHKRTRGKPTENGANNPQRKCRNFQTGLGSTASTREAQTCASVPGTRSREPLRK